MELADKGLAKMKTYTFKEEAYGRKIVLVWDCRNLEYARYIDRRFGTEYEKEWEEDDRCKGCLTHFASHVEGDAGSVIYSLYIEKLKTNIEGRRELVHEILHLVFTAFSQIGIVYDMSSEEAFCYYFDMLYGKIWNILTKKRRRNSAIKKGFKPKDNIKKHKGVKGYWKKQRPGGCDSPEQSRKIQEKTKKERR